MRPKNLHYKLPQIYSNQFLEKRHLHTYNDEWISFKNRNVLTIRIRMLLYILCTVKSLMHTFYNHCWRAHKRFYNRTSYHTKRRDDFTYLRRELRCVNVQKVAYKDKYSTKQCNKRERNCIEMANKKSIINQHPLCK